MRTAGELYDGDKAPEPKETLASDSHSDPKPEPTVETKPAGETPAAVKTVDEVAFEDDAEAKPVDVSGYEKALDAARGDKRKAKKLWQEAKAKIAEEVAKARKEADAEAYQRAVAQFAPKPQAPKVEAPPEPDLNDTNFFDPQAVKAFVAHQIQSGISGVQAQWHARNRAAAMERHADFNEVLTDFQEAAKVNPNLWTQAENSADPAECIYRTGKQLRELQGIGTIDELRAKIRAEVEAEMKVAPQVQPQPVLQTAIKPPLPKSIASVRGTGLGVKPEWQPHTAEQLYDS